jgi:hypothetical protein
MPGGLIRQFTSQADWQSGTAEGLDLTSRPGDVVPTADYIKQYLVDDDWLTGTRDQITVGSDRIQLSTNNLRYTGVFNQYRYDSFSYGSFTIRQRMNLRGFLQKATWLGARYSSDGVDIDATFIIRAVSDSRILYQSPTLIRASVYSAWGVGSSNINIELTEDVYFELQFNAPSSGPVRLYLDDGGSSSPLVEICPEFYRRNGVLQNSRGLIDIIMPQGYYESGTWTSPWLAHGKGTSPASSLLLWSASTPAGSGVIAEVRWSADNGATATAWEQATNEAKMPGTPRAYVQIRLTLTATPDLQDTPVVSGLTAIVGPLHRWTSPVISITDTGDPKLISMLTVGLKVLLEVRIGAGAWQASSGLMETGSATTMQIRLTLARTGSGDQYLSELTVLEALILHMLEEPKPQIRPPDVTHVICYVEDSEPLIEVTASLPDVPEDKRIEVRISVPAGSSEAYAQAYANAYLAVHGVEKRSLTCRVPICTRIGFAELVAVAYKPWGRGLDNPWLAMVQEITHYPLAEIPATELVVGDYQPDDTEALVQLIVRGG